MTTLLLALLDAGLAGLPWDSWSWAVPQAPIEYFFRRHQDVLVKSPDHECQCPPNKDCTAEYKINEDMPDFLKIQGLINDEKLKQLKKDIEDAQKGTQEPRKGNIRSRRQNKDQECCCPPRTVMMPTFITDKKFNEVADRFKKKILFEE